jgi:DNA primase
LITPQSIELIKSRIDIIDIIGDYISLKKRGVNYLGNCPFHNEKSPSFTVSPTKEIYKCFGCGKSGNSITFLMEHDKLSYVEALKWLAKRYNVEIEETEQSQEQKQLQQVGDSLYIINNFAQQFFKDKLFDTAEGQTIALSYLKERGFREDIIKKFQIGFSPREKDVLANALIAHQFNKDIFAKAGLVTSRNKIDWQDNYRGRIVFPIHNNSGKILGFGARVIGKVDNAPKYINTPENEIYSKSKILYGLYFAKHSIDKNDECFLVEGYTDVVSLHQAGIENVVASGGTSLTIEQLRLVKKFTNNLTIIYDGDAAGIKASLRGMDMALEESLNVRLVLIPDKEDPDSYVNKVGVAAFNEFVSNNKKDIIIFQLEVMMKEASNDVAKKSEVVNHIAETISKINRVEDFTKVQDYIKQCATILKIEETGLHNLVNKFKRDKIAKDDKQKSFEPPSAIEQNQAEFIGENNIDDNSVLLNLDEPQERNLLRVLLEHGLKNWDTNTTIAQHIFNEVAAFSFDNKLLEQLLETYKQLYFENQKPDAKYFIYSQDKDFAAMVNSITMFPHELSTNWDNILEGMNIVNRDVSINDVIMSLNYFKLKKIKKLFIHNQEELKNTTSFEQQIQLLEVHKQLKDIEREITQQLGTVIF